jgi:hypothetical protein
MKNLNYIRDIIERQLKEGREYDAKYLSDVLEWIENLEYAMVRAHDGDPDCLSDMTEKVRARREKAKDW